MAVKISKIAIGLSLQEGQAQLTYFYPSMREPDTVRRGGEGEEASHVIPADPAVWRSACGLGEGISTLQAFLKSLLEEAAGADNWENIHIMVTVPRLERLLSSRLPQALTMLGIPRKNIYLQDHHSSFYHYTINQKKELYNGDVALIEGEDSAYTGYVMHIDRSKSPALVRIERAGAMQLQESQRDGRDDEAWGKEKDRLFFEFLKKVFERRNVITCYLTGDLPDLSAARRSIAFLTSGRHAFAGDNLYTRGACFAAMERCDLRQGKDMLFMGKDIITDNISMYLRVKGKEVYYPLVSAGVNWYEAHHECEIIPEADRSLTVRTRPMTGGEETSHVLLLDGFPDRPARASRLKMTVYFTAPECCWVEVEDMGFGGFYRPSGRKWSRRIILK